MRLVVSTPLECTAEAAWQRVRASKLLLYVAAPLVRFVPLAPRAFPEVWVQGDYEVMMRLFGAIPIGRQRIGIRFPEGDAPGTDGTYRLLDDGGGSLIRTWRHLIEIAPDGPGRARYTDTLEIEAGPLTPLVWVFAWIFYHHRQRRWRRLVAEVRV